MDVGTSLVFVGTVSKHMKTYATVFEPVGDKDITEWEDCFSIVSNIYMSACMKNDELPDWFDNINFDYNVGSLTGHKATLYKDDKMTARFDISLKYGLKIGDSIFELKKLL
jgi:hypothetical protein